MRIRVFLFIELRMMRASMAEPWNAMSDWP